MAIRIKGRNGFFTYYGHNSGILADTEGYVCIYSNSPHTQSPPVQFDGPPRQVINLLRQMARELENANRANTAHNFHKERIRKT